MIASRFWGRLGLAALALCSVAMKANAQDALCAEAKIEILQELTLERQGFEAIMRITNSLDTFALENVNITVNFTDQDGLPVVATSNSSSSTAAFFIRVDDSRNISGLSEGSDGDVVNGRIAQGVQGEVRWLIIPTANAAGQTQNGKLYFVGATLTYRVGGEEETVVVVPDSIVVKPQPLLTLDYFLTQEVIADDPFTPEIEPPVPYTLGLRVTNSGFGAAGNVAIESAQPRIVENTLGLALDFQILSSYLNDHPASPTLTINFGNIAAQEVAVGRWIMQSNLSGEFTAFTASFTHSDELGGQLTSLLQATNAHFLLKDVRVDLSGRDSIKDFLATDANDQLYVYESESTGLSDSLCINCAAVTQRSATLSGQGSSRTVSTSATAGFSYLKVPDPFKGSQSLRSVIRDDGKPLLPENAWLSKERAADKINFNYYINIFDVNGTGSYTLNFGEHPIVPQPPVIQAINPRTTYEGGSVGFLVQASDPNNTIPSLSVVNLPAGASFSDSNNGSGVFSWEPRVGQAGVYHVSFVASDGVLQAERTVTITVNPANDRDGDGMADDWELEHFGDLSRDGTGDFDGDGRTDLEEFLAGTNPTIAESAPTEPRVANPIYDAEVLAGASGPLLPTLTIINSVASDAESIRYLFEVYSDASMNLLVASGVVDQTGSETSWQVRESDLEDGQVFRDNSLYYWRVRAEATNSTGTVPSQWVTSRFFINTENDPPSVPQISSPAIGAVVANLRPTLVVTNAFDLDRDNLTYGFELFDELDSSEPLAQVNGILPGAGGTTQWQLPNPLEEDGAYLWRVWVEDEHGTRSTSETGSFVVSVVNSAPTKPVISSPPTGANTAFLLEGEALDLVVRNARDPEHQPLSYFFELDVVNTFDSGTRLRSPPIAEGDGETSWRVYGLGEDMRYYWRVKASDSVVDSDWVSSDFIVTLINQAPSVPTLNNPGNDTVVTTLRPLFELNPSVDPEGDPIFYRFEIYRDEGLTDLVATHRSTSTQWALDFDLADNSEYFWRARAEDSHQEASEWSPANRFFLNENNIDDPPEFSFVRPATNIVADDPLVVIQWIDSDPDSNASIDLYYLAGNGQRGLIVAGLSEDDDGEGDQYVWDTSTVAPGVYSLLAVVSDDTSAIEVTSCCTVTVPLQEKTISVTPLSDLVTSESGEPWVQVQVVLDQPLQTGTSLTINLSVSDPGELSILGNPYLYFTPENWDVPQVVTLKGQDDCEADGDQDVSLRFATVVSDDPAYSGLTLESVRITNVDNEHADQVLFICSYQLESQTPVTGSDLVDFHYRPQILNTGVSLESALAQLTLLPSFDPDHSVELVSSDVLEFGELPSGETRPALGTFTLRYPPSQTLDRAKLTWTILPGPPASDAIEGDDGDNVLHGTSGDDIIYGRGGNDVLFGGAGNDVLVGGPGADVMYGEEGDDTFIIEGNDPHADKVFGGEGYDIVLGGDGDDAIRLDGFFGEQSVEEIDGKGGTNVIYGTPGDDILDFTNTLLKNISRIEGLAGNDLIKGSQGDDVIYGGPGNDHLYGNGGNDTFVIRGNEAGINRISGGDGYDQILGGEGDDALRLSRFDGEYTVERIDLGAGHNIIEGSNADNLLDFRNTAVLNVARIDGLGGDDIIHGSDGADVIVGNHGNDTLYGHGGDDVFLFTHGDTGFDRYNGGAGKDTLLGTPFDDTFRMDVFSGEYTVEVIDGNGGFNRIQGSDGNNTLDFRNTQLISIAEIDGGGGDDTIYGSNGPDVIISGPGNNTLYGSGGDDTFVLRGKTEGFDRYSGGDGTDRLIGTDGDDTFRIAGFEREFTVEIIDGRGGFNRILAPDTNTTFDFRNTQLLNINLIQGGSGDDTIYGSPSNDVIAGGAGNNALYGEGGDDTFLIGPEETGYSRYNGGPGTDRIEGSQGDDLIRLSFFSGDYSVEIIDGKGGHDVIKGTDNSDVLDFSNTQLIGIAAIDSGAGNDVVQGNDEENIFIIGAGDSEFHGHGGDDRFLLTPQAKGYNLYNGGEGFDRIEGSTEDDVIRLSNFSRENSIELIDGKNGFNIIQGTQGNDRLDFSGTQLVGIARILGGAGDDIIIGSPGDDVIVVGPGNNKLYGGGGDDRFLLDPADSGYNLYNGGPGTDLIEGTAGDDIIRLSSFSGQNTVEIIDGFGGHNILQGSDSNSTLDFSNTTLHNIAAIHGGAGNDTIIGSAGDDRIVGGPGDDTLSGRGGSDTYVFARGDGFDTILDDGDLASTDVIEFVGDIKPSDIWLVRVGFSLDIYVRGSNNRIRVKDFYRVNSRKIELIRTETGHTLNTKNMSGLVAIMTLIGRPPDRELPPAQQRLIDALSAVAWRLTHGHNHP